MQDAREPRLKNCDGVYEPAEDSYLLADAVRSHAFGSVLDIGTGTGIQGITAALKGCSVTFADLDDRALKCAKENAAQNEVSGEFIKSDIFSRIKPRYNTIVFNPPYLPGSTGKEEKVAYLDGGRHGRELIDRFLSQYRRHVLDDHVVLLLESSFNGYEKDVKALGAEIVGRSHAFFEDIAVLKFR